jgi:signal transduction histidine kinase
MEKTRWQHLMNILQQHLKKDPIILNGYLKVAHKKLSSLNKDLERKVKDRTAKVEKLLKQKDEFIGQLGHDLKNPLNPLVNLLPIVEKHEKDPESKELLHVINRNVDYMKNLVVKTIKLARLNASGTEFSFEDINLLEKINVVVEKNKPMLDEDHMMVESKINEDIIVKADELRLEELFDNLVNNAVKYSPNGGNITIDAKEDKDFVIVSVKDLGIGMTEGQLDHIFDEFYKADESRHDFHSSGLGLTICKRIVEKHGGRIWAESSGEGHGSTVFFTIPKS